MYYSSIGIIAVLVLLIINHEILFHQSRVHAFPGLRAYRQFLIGVFAYYVTDILWGFLDEAHLIQPLYVDTVFYFLFRAVSVLLWTQFVIAYLEEKNAFTVVIRWVGWLYLAFEVIAVVINFFQPILFWFDAAGKYQTGPLRHFSLLIQILMFLLTTLLSVLLMSRSQGSARARLRTIAFFGLAMVLLLAIQVFDALLPLYTTGYLLGTCLLHTFVIEQEQREQWLEMQALLSREQEHKLQIANARHLAYTDALTGVKSKLAYVEMETALDQEIAEGRTKGVAIAVFDLNDLKHINDSMGHESGDQHIREACSLICNHFRHSPVYRIGGDEFAAILRGPDYENRKALVASFAEQMEARLREGSSTVIAMGVADYAPGVDKTFRSVFDRADRHMYTVKQRMKASSV